MYRSLSTGSLRLFKALLLYFITTVAMAQNSMIGDGFGGRLWYRPTNYTVGSYSAFTICNADPCDGSSDQLIGWGGDNVGEMANGPTPNCVTAPVVIPGMSDVRYFNTGYWMGVIKNDGTGWVWGGMNGFAAPTQVITDAKFVDASARLTSFVKNDGTVWSIGSNEMGQFGDGSTTDNFATPVQMSGVTDAVRVAVGLFASYVLRSDGTVFAVGTNTDGLMGDPSIVDPFTTTVVPIPGLTDIIDIKAHAIATVALDANGDVFSWGRGGFTGDGDWVTDVVPQRVAGLSNIVAISGCTDGDHFLVLDAERNCSVFGQYNFSSYHLAPELVSTDVVDIMAGETFSYVVKADGTLWASGSSLCGSIWMDQPNFLHPAVNQVLTQLHPSAVLGTCPLEGCVAIPSATCTSGSITIHRFGGDAPYTYDIGTGPQSSNVFADVPLGTYTVSVTDATGCAITIPCTVDPVGLEPVVVDMGTVYACRYEGYTLPSGATAYPPGTYSDTTSSVLGCDTVRLFEVLPLWVNWQIELCEGEPFTLPNGNVVYAPSYHEVNAVLDTLLYPSPCDTTNSVTLVLSNLPPIVAGITTEDSVISLGESAELYGGWGASYSWSPGATLSCTTCPNPTATPAETTEYCVVVGGIASSGIGCGLDTACITITVLPPVVPRCSAERIFVPTAFSPNASGKNDLQCVHGGECIRSMTFAIYDRWGNKVFQSSDPKACWDGIYNGQPLDPAVFVYHLSATLANGESLERQGNITLVR